MALVSNSSRFSQAARQRALWAVRPKHAAIGCLALLAALGWAWLGLTVAAMEPASSLPVPDTPPWRTGLSGWGRTAFEVLCHPAFGRSGGGIADIAAVVPMWIAMTAAMMLPTAGPMILTYAEMAETAGRDGGDHPAAPLPLIAGYGFVWAGFAVAAAVLQIALTRAALLDPAMTSVSGLFSGAVFVAAGVYQFSALKETCVMLCQRPAPFFAANWPQASHDVFRLGVRQGLYCLGCCWAMMLVMFAIGVMNVFWMAALGFIMAAEKIASTTRFSKAIGAVFIAVGAGFIAAAVAAHWPVRAQ